MGDDFLAGASLNAIAARLNDGRIPAPTDIARAKNPKLTPKDSGWNPRACAVAGSDRRVPLQLDQEIAEPPGCGSAHDGGCQAKSPSTRSRITWRQMPLALNLEVVIYHMSSLIRHDVILPPAAGFASGRPAGRGATAGARAHAQAAPGRGRAPAT